MFCGIKKWRNKFGWLMTLHRCHVVPRAWGGLGKPNNTIILCQKCHTSFDRFVGVTK